MNFNKSISIGLLVLFFGFADFGKVNSVLTGRNYPLLAEDIEKAIEKGIPPKTIKRYQKAGISHFCTMEYFHFLGISPETVIDYVKSGVVESADIVKEEFKNERISQIAQDLFQYYNIKHPEWYRIEVIDELIGNRFGIKNDKSGLIYLIEEGEVNDAIDDFGIDPLHSENFRTGAIKRGLIEQFLLDKYRVEVFEVDDNPNLEKKLLHTIDNYKECALFGFISDNKSLRLIFGEEFAENMTPSYREAINNFFDIKLFKEYIKAGIKHYKIIDYLTILGIDPYTARLKISAGANNSDKIIYDLFLAGDISPRAKKVFDYYSICNPQRYDSYLFRELEKNMELVPGGGKSLAVIIVGDESNPLGGFSNGYENFNTGEYNFWDDTFDYLLAYYNTLVYEAVTDKEAIKHITEVGEKYGHIDLLWISAHANEQVIGLAGERGGGYLNLTVSDTAIMKQIAPYLGPHSIIVLDGCNTGKGGTKANNIANTLAKYTGAIVYGSMHGVSKCGIETDHSGKLANFICDGEAMLRFGPD